MNSIKKKGDTTNEHNKKRFKKLRTAAQSCQNISNFFKKSANQSNNENMNSKTHSVSVFIYFLKLT